MFTPAKFNKFRHASFACLAESLIIDTWNKQGLQFIRDKFRGKPTLITFKYLPQ